MTVIPSVLVAVVVNGPIDGVRVVEAAVVVDVGVDAVESVAKLAQVRVALLDVVETFFFNLVIVVADNQEGNEGD